MGNGAVWLRSPGGAAALLLPEEGGRLEQLRLLGGAGQPRDLLAPTPPGQRGWGKVRGMPVLFPFPGRVAQGCYRWEGRSYQLPRNDPDSSSLHHLHGLAADVAWKAEAVTAQRARLSQRWEQLPAELREGYPWRYQLEADYRLGDRRLAIAFTLRNAGEQALPFGLGLHPYWQLPGGRLSLPSTSHWPQREFIPTGERQKLPTELDLRQPREIAELRGDPFNATYWGRRGPIADLEQPGSWRLRIRARPRRDWPAVVVYRPPEAGIICTEPQTCTPDAVHLGERAGLRALLPGQRWRGVVEFELR